METLRRSGFPVVRLRFNERVGEVRDVVEPVLTMRWNASWISIGRSFLKEPKPRRRIRR